MSDSLLALARARLTGIFSETAANAQCVLLVDQHTLPLLSSSVKLSELQESASHITLVESVDAPLVARAPAAFSAVLDVIYFLSPTLASLELALSDHEVAESAAPAYGGRVHFVFSRRLPEQLLQRLRASTAVGRVATLRELNLDFLPISSSAFSLGATDALRRLYGPCEPRVREAYLATLAEQLSTVYRALGQPAPRVRYSQECHPIAEAFATRLDALLRDASSRARESAAASVGGQPARTSQRGTLLILERAIDPVTPLLYDFSYEALAEGLGLLDSGRFTRPNGKVHLLLESDAVWSDLRARPFEEVPDKLKEHSDAFVLENESVLKAQRGEAMSLARRQEASRAQFSFGFVKRRDALRIQQELVSALTKRLLDGSGERTKLFEQLNIEQDLATGRTADGYDVHPRDVVPRVRKALAEMVAAGKEAEREEAARAAAAAAKAAEEDAQAERGDHVGEDNGGGGPLGQRGVARSEIGDDCGAMERCRLLTLFSTCRQPDDAVLDELAASCELPATSHAALQRSAAYLGLPLYPLPRAPPPNERAADVPLGRYEPRLRSLLQTALNGNLSTKQFPYVDGDDGTEGDAADPFHTGGPRATAASAGEEPPPSPRSEIVGTWAIHRRRALARVEGGDGQQAVAGAIGGPFSPGGGDERKDGPRLIVFMLGGASHAELRCALEAGGRDKVVFGCTAVHTPLEYLRALREAGGEQVLMHQGD